MSDDTAVTPTEIDPILDNGAELAPGYLVTSHLNRGHMLDVYAVYSLERATSCIAKTLRPSQQNNPGERQQLIHEARLLVDYTHPHLVRGYELIDRAERTVLIMETLTGATLSKVITDQGALGIDDVIILGDQISALLHYLHRSGIVHLDLKPSNIVTDAGIARVIDLSLASPIGTAQNTAGTYEYKAPEQITGAPVQEATDIWGLGGILYRSITGHRPFPRTTVPRDAATRPELTDLPHCNARLSSLISRCFELNPTDRPSLDQLRTELHAVRPCCLM